MNLRLGRAPTVEEVERHAAAHDGLGRWLLCTTEGAYWEVFQAHVKEGVIYLDEVDDDGARLAGIVDAIPLGADDQPCPVGGWTDGHRSPGELYEAASPAPALDPRTVLRKWPTNVLPGRWAYCLEPGLPVVGHFYAEGDAVLFQADGIDFFPEYFQPGELFCRMPEEV